ncbi:hypothetical protein Gotur_031015 [Gossypium turneri]
MECRMNHKDNLKGIWKSWDGAKKTHFQDKIPLIGVLRSMKWIWYGLSRNILPFSTMTLEILSRYIRRRTSIFGDP